MITWMQRHRKYLVITIWISTIAFVGAGFVGWGSYDYGSLSSNVATVGKINITRDEFSTTYSQIFNNYNKMLGGKLGEKEAKEMGIDKMAMQSLVSQALFENFAKEIDLHVSDQEVAEKISQIKAFQVNGVFNKQKYLDTLKESDRSLDTKKYEEGLKKYILLQKIQDLLKPQISELEARAIANASFGADRVEVKILKLTDMKVQASDDEVKQYWEKNKNNFKTKPAYDLEIMQVKVADFKNSDDELKKAYAEYGSNYKEQNGSLMSFDKAKTLVNLEESKKKAKKEALKKFVALKNGEITGIKLSKAEIDSKDIPIDLAQELLKLKDAENIKPIELGDGFIFAKVSKLYKSEPLPFDQAKAEAKLSFLKDKSLLALKESAKNEQQTFKGADIGYVTKADSAKLSFLSPEEAQKFVTDLFESKKESGVVIFSDKAVLYRISEQRLLGNDEFVAKKEFLNANILPFKSSLINEGLLENLKKKYEVKIYMDISKPK